MRRLFLLPLFFFTLLIFFSPVLYGDFSYDIDRFTVVSGSATFVDEFDDDVEPPNGSSGPSTYNVSFGAFSANAESGGILNMNSNDAGILGDEIAIGVSLLDNTYHFIPGSGGFVEVKFSFPGGITANSFFDLDISSQPWEPNNPNEAVELSIAMDTLGVISAFFVAYVDDGLNEVDIVISEIDITGLLGTTTDLTMRLDISIANVVTASLDFGSDGTFDLTMSGSHTLTFPGGKPYKGGFGPGMDLDPTPDIKANGSDGPVAPTDNLSVTVALDPGSRSGENADWWVAAETPFGWYHYDLGRGSWVPGLTVTYQGPLFDLPKFEVLNMTGLPEGRYTFYFGVDTDMNGSLDSGLLFFDFVVVNISVTVSPCTNISGNWFVTETLTITCCLGGDCETETVRGTDSITIQQSGCNISYDINISGFGTFSRTGTIDGNNIQLSGIFAVLQPLCSETQNVVTISGTTNSDKINLHGSGIVESTCNGISFSCTGDSTTVLTRLGSLSALEIMDEEEFKPSSQLLNNYLEIFTTIAH